MAPSGLSSELVETCRGHALDSSSKATVPEPYIPYVPDQWNGILVLAEAQNHGKASADYLDWLRSLSPGDRLRRLYLREDGLGIQPWDDGSLKIAVQAACRADVDATAVSNAVLWSTVEERGTNATPTKFLINPSATVWRDLLAVLQPKLIVTSGKIARDLVTSIYDGVAPTPPLVALQHPAPSNLSRMSGIFDQDDLLERYPEVRAVHHQHPEWFSKYSVNKVFFGCHAVSRARRVTSGD